MSTKQDAMAKGAKCYACPLNNIGRFVPSAGPEKAEVAMIGEAPGANEARKGIPFIGASGQLMDRVNRYHGMEREDLFLTNACLCRPPDNATPAKTAILACRPRLITELEEHGVTTAVALGNSAARAVLDQEGVFKLRVGPGKESPFLPGLKVIPTIHPAACLRPKMAGMFPDLVTDVGKVQLGGQRPEWKMPEFIVSQGRKHAIHLVKMLWQYQRLVVDIETAIEKDEVFDHPNNYDLLCIGIGYAKDKVVVFSEEDCHDPLVLKAIALLLRSPGRRLTMHNGKSDCGGLYPTMGNILLWFDTMLAHYVQDERSGHPLRGLGLLGQEQLGFPNWKAWIAPYVTKEYGYRSVPRERLYPYNAVDVQATWYLEDLYAPILESRPELLKLHDFLIEASNEIKFLELNGLAVDREYLKELTRLYQDKLLKLELEIDEVLDPKWGARINPRSPMQVKSYLAFHGVTVDSTRIEILEKVYETLEMIGKSDHPLAEFLRRLFVHRKEQKLFSTYVKGVTKRLYRGRVFPTILLHGTTTGRPSARNPNNFNIPRASIIKKLYIPGRPGNVFVQADQSQSEGRVLTWLAQEDYLRDIFNDPTRDIFNELMQTLYAVDFLARLDAEARKDTRVRVKAFFYGLSYGRTAYSIAQEFRISVREAEKFERDFFAVIPNVVAFRKEVLRKIHAGEDLITPFGRHRRFWLITDSNRKDIENEALAFYPQSISSDICLSAVIKLRREFSGQGIYIRNFVYDSILTECTPDAAEDVGKRMSEVLIGCGRDVVDGYVDFATEVKIGNNWADV